MENKILFQFLGDNIIYIADVQDICEHAYTEDSYEISGITTAKERSILEDMKFAKNISIDDVQKQMSQTIGHKLQFKYCNHLTPLTQKNKLDLYFDTYEGAAATLLDYESTPAYTWWDGRQYNVREIDWTQEIIVSDRYLLDMWDGHNRCFGGAGYHAEVRYYTTDDNSETGYLFIDWCDYQGSLNLREAHLFDDALDLKKYLIKEHYGVYQRKIQLIDNDIQEILKLKK